ncbi:beta-2-microglobulin [Rhineura floridana]|uniref:beta-2-microglobulin n=1 Tax=Rhineura floridana TaxID=261503 RepID=UPI002AC85018|nr:beta-2-microglobulin [Rhineura floridana]
MAKPHLLLCVVLLLFISTLEVISTLEASTRTPNVQVYSRHPLEIGKKNELNCYVDQFHPPKINITLLRNSQPLENMQHSDLSFDKTWAFNRLVYAEVVPNGKDKFFCKVEHSTLKEPKIVMLDQEY